MVTAIVLIKADVARIPETAEAIAQIEQVSEVYSVTGEFDLVAMVRVRGHDELGDVIPGLVNRVSGVTHTETHIAFRAYYPNPDRLLRHGQSGNVLVTRGLTDVFLIPKAATFQIKGQRCVYLLDKEDVARQTKITVQNELDDLFVIKGGIAAGDKIIVEGIEKVQNGEKVKYEMRAK